MLLYCPANEAIRLTGATCLPSTPRLLRKMVSEHPGEACPPSSARAPTMGDPSTLKPAFIYPLPQEGRVSPVFIPWDCCVTLGHIWLSLSGTEGKEVGEV